MSPCFVRTLLGLVSLVGTPLLAKPSFPDFTKDGNPNLQSASAVVTEWPKGTTLFEKNADAVRPIASLSKMMAAYVLHEECKLDPSGLHEMTPANRDAAKGGDKSKLMTGWSYSHADLLHAALMRSDNRALPALGQACGMTPAEFGARMTARAKAMGLSQTSFAEPNGLSAENVSTAREVAIILKTVLEQPDLTAVMTKSKSAITGFKNGRSRRIEIRNTDRLLSRDSLDMIGGKTGYTDLARYCFAGAARFGAGRQIAMVFLGSEGKHTRFGDFMRAYKWVVNKVKDATEEVQSLTSGNSSVQ